MENPQVRIWARYRHFSQFLRAVNIYSQNPTLDFPSENWVYNDWDDSTRPPPTWWDYTLEVFAHNVRAFSPPQEWSSKRLDYNALHAESTPSLLPNNGVKGDSTLEIYDQLRPSGRILEHFRAALGGSKPTTGHTVLHG